MSKFIELTQRADTLDGSFNRKIRVNVQSIDFYYNQHLVFGNRSINVLESYDEIKKAMEDEK